MTPVTKRLKEIVKKRKKEWKPPQRKSPLHTLHARCGKRLSWLPFPVSSRSFLRRFCSIHLSLMYWKENEWRQSANTVKYLVDRLGGTTALTRTKNCSRSWTDAIASAVGWVRSRTCSEKVNYIWSFGLESTFWKQQDQQIQEFRYRYIVSK